MSIYNGFCIIKHYFIIFQILYEAFFNAESAKDIASMTYNMNLVGNSNARGNVLGKFNECKEFVNFETDALLITLAMQYFWIKNLKASPEDVIPPTILHGSKETKLEWLNGHVKKMILQYIVESHSKDASEIHQNMAALSEPRNCFVCRHQGCPKVYRFDNIRRNHEEKVHSFSVQSQSEASARETSESSSSSDDIFNYCTARLNIGLLIRNADDAVKEGDGDRIMRCWKMFLLYYKAYGHHKYAIASFLLQSNVMAIFTEAQAQQIVWNRTVNRKGGRGRNISCDLRLEQINRLSKELLHNLGVNLNESAAKRESMAIGFLEKILQSIDEDMHLTVPSGHHKVKVKEVDLHHLVGNLVSKDIFKYTNGRKHEKYKGFERNLLARLDVASLASWLTGLRKQLAKKYQ